MRGAYLIAVLYVAEASAFGAALPVRAQDSGQPGGATLSAPTLQPALPLPTPAPVPQPAPDPAPAAPAAAEPVPATPEPSVAPPSESPLAALPASIPDPVVTLIRSKLGEANLRKGANPDDLAALEAFYRARAGGPLWMTEMGVSTKGQQALFEIGKADDWGLDPTAFELPSAGDLPANAEAEAVAEIKLDLAVLKYARFARGGRLNPPDLNDKFNQVPPLRDPKTVLAEIAASDAPDSYLQSLHPKHEQFARLRQALLKARGKDEEAERDSAKPANDRDIKRIVINMERWRWMPEDLGSIYVWNNSPEFMLYVVKDGKTIYADKTLVGTSAYATPIFDADMTNIIFNPDWVAPETVVTENLLPPLRDGNYSILKVHKLSVSYNGKPIDPRSVDWGRVNIKAFAFTQKGGPDNVLGKVKFWFPNRHTVYMHDTLAYRKKYFQKPVRGIGHDCVRMEKPEQFADVLLAEGKGWSAAQVKEQWDTGVNSAVALDHPIPVHMTYFTVVVDEAGKVSAFPDLYGFDRKLASALFGNNTGFPAPPPDTTVPREDEADASSPSGRAAASHNDIAGSLGAFLGD
jgi:L,D-transpeptidase YcbB